MSDRPRAIVNRAYSGMAPISPNMIHMVARRDALSGAEFRVARETLGFSREALADLLRVKTQLVRQWDQGTSRVPPGVVAELRHLHETADAQVERLLSEIRSGQRSLIQVPAGPAGSFQRAVAGRVLRQVDVEVTYLDE